MLHKAASNVIGLDADPVYAISIGTIQPLAVLSAMISQDYTLMDDI